MLATDNFSKAYQFRDTGFSRLYRAELDHFDKIRHSSVDVQGKNKGDLPKRHDTVVIKRIRPTEDGQGESLFFTELEMLTTCKHENIVTLLGFCHEGSEMILVIEHPYNGYLDDYMDNVKDKSNLTWAKRLKICLDVAHGLKYLHYEIEDKKTIIHRDIKSRNIALDENWDAKIVDFGLSIFLPPNQEDDTLHLSYIAGTKRYIDPEYEKTRKLKRESDVYSFGVYLFEILCGRSAYDKIYRENEKGLAFVARQCFHEGTLKEMIDPIIKKENEDNSFSLKKGPIEDSFDKFIEIAYQCTAETQNQRPTMNVVVKELEKVLFLQVSQYISISINECHKVPCGICRR